MADSATYLAEIVGEESLQGQRMQAGAILDLMDVVAGQVAIQHCGGPAVTLSFDRVDLILPIMHADLIRLEGRLAAVGNSSMMVEVDVFRQDIPTRQFIPVQTSFVTMVAIDANRRPNRNIPGLRVETPEERAVHARAQQHKAMAAAWTRMHEETRALTRLRAADVEDPVNRGKQEYLRPDDTVIHVRRAFMPRHTNILGTVFGGDVLLWMDRVATNCARRFTRDPNMITLAMNRILFKEPIFTTDLVEMVARVVYVRRYTLEVEIAVTLRRLDGREVPSHSGYFTVLDYDDTGVKHPIRTGLQLSDADPENLLRYLQARRRHEFWQEHQGK